MTQPHGKRPRQVALVHREIGATHAGGDHPQPHLAFAPLLGGPDKAAREQLQIATAAAAAVAPVNEAGTALALLVRPRLVGRQDRQRVRRELPLELLRRAIQAGTTGPSSRTPSGRQRPTTTTRIASAISGR